MRQDWQDKIAASNTELEGMLGSQNPRMRCAARFGIAVTEPLNAWYADELARGTDPAVLLEVLPRCLGQVLGIIVFNQGGHPALAQATLSLVGVEACDIINRAQAGALDQMKVRKLGAAP